MELSELSNSQLVNAQERVGQSIKDIDEIYKLVLEFGFESWISAEHRDVVEWDLKNLLKNIEEEVERRKAQMRGIRALREHQA